MIAVLFEVLPIEGGLARYLGTAAKLRLLLDDIPGFISVERFQSLTNPDKLLSLSFFEDEDAVRRWRETEEHRAAQEAGRSGLFAEYRLRIASVIRDYGLHDRVQAPAVSPDRSELCEEAGK